MLENLLETNFLKIAVFAQVVVFIAMGIDLGSGLHKASQRGEVHTSWGFKATLDKMIRYNGSLLITSCMDLFIYFSNLFVAFGVENMQGIPISTCVWGFFLCFIEYKSVRESSDVKTKKKMKVAKDELEEMLRKAAELKKELTD